MHSNQSTNKLAANDNQIKLTIHDVQTISQYEYKKCTKKLLKWGLKVMRTVPVKHIINFFTLIFILRDYQVVHGFPAYKELFKHLNLGYCWRSV